MKYLLTLLFALCLLIPANGSNNHCNIRRVAVQQHVVQQHHNVVNHAVQQYAVQQYAAVAIPTPVYPVFGVGYSGNWELKNEILELKKEILGLRSGIFNNHSNDHSNGHSKFLPTPNINSNKINSNFANVVQGKCLRCHNDNKKEGNVSFSSLHLLSRETLKDMFRQVITERMPPNGNKLSDDELKLFDDVLDSTK